jgi:hypothetical protein
MLIIIAESSAKRLKLLLHLANPAQNGRLHRSQSLRSAEIGPCTTIRLVPFVDNLQLCCPECDLIRALRIYSGPAPVGEAWYTSHAEVSARP